MINAVGRSDLSLKLDIIKKIVGIALLIFSIPFGIVMMAWGRCIGQWFASLCDAYPNKKIIGYSYLEQMKDLIPNIIANAIMFVSVYGMGIFFTSNLVKLIVQILVGIAVYLLCSIIMKLEGFEYAKYQAKRILKKSVHCKMKMSI